MASVIGDVPRVADPDRARLTPSSTVLIRATRQGLVAFDGNGQVEPALAESWTFTKDGLSAIFRLRRLRWANGGEVTGREVAASLNRAIASNSRNTLKPLLSSVETVIGMTDRVVEIRLKVPRPNLLELLAQPELAIRRGGSGTGPWVMVDAIPHGVRLRPVKDDDDPATDEIVMPPIREVLLRGERAGVAIARFMAARGGYVTGGTLGNWPVAQAAGLKSGVVRFDPAEGLFGLAVMRGSPALQDAALRNALSMAINREALVTGFGLAGSGAGRWRAIDRLLPTQMDSAQLPAAPAWSTASLVDRRIEARRLVAKAAAVPVLRVALPAGPGMTVLFARLAADWRAIGVSVVRVAANADADLRLIDEVAPNASANWYLTRTSCDAGLACDTGVDAALKASRAAPDLAGRAVQIATADAAAAAAAAYIPLATPVRWSLVDPALTGFHENSFAVHPLAELRLPRN
ncbi:ABC transporter substrate-binding protein [Sphingomonas sp.]|uniref:ABC transporter substrate-binding protein n=1 Tax=Sphingomonas sp. TaxID=28214 RepID=UPI0025D822C0|nr:ABC transporter substrate-binding protein [Sphingomonas sp.]